MGVPALLVKSSTAVAWPDSGLNARVLQNCAGPGGDGGVIAKCSSLPAWST